MNMVEIKVADIGDFKGVEAIPLLVTETAHASPSVRKYSRELGVDLARLSGTGPKGRIQRSDVQAPHVTR